MADIDNVKMGVVSVVYGTTDLGHTKGGATVTVAFDRHEVTVDRYGSTPAKVVNKGLRFSAKVRLAEYQLDVLQALLPSAGQTADIMVLGGTVGDEVTGAKLVLHPIANEVSDLSEDVVMWNAVVVSPVELPYLVDQERVFEVEFVAVIDETQTDGEMLGLIGDSTELA